MMGSEGWRWKGELPRVGLEQLKSARWVGGKYQVPRNCGPDVQPSLQVGPSRQKRVDEKPGERRAGAAEST